MPDPHALQSLAARLAAATGPDRDLDADMWWILDRQASEIAYWLATAEMPRPLGNIIPSRVGRAFVKECSPPFTESLDAALSLVEAKLPGQAIVILGIALLDFRVTRNWRELPICVCRSVIAALMEQSSGQA